MWFVYATLASAFWGLTYVMSEQVFKHVSIPTVLAINAGIIAIIAAIAAVVTGVLRTDLNTIASSGKVAGLIIAGALVLVVAELFISLSIVEKNASLAGLVEITYPLFIAIFAYLFFKETQVTLPIALGGLLIFCGVVVVYWFSR